MEEKLNKIQLASLIFFACAYALAMLVNTVMAIAGRASFAYWHAAPAAGLSYYAWNRVPLATRRRVITAVRSSIKKTARLMLCSFRAVRSLPALFIKSFRQAMEAVTLAEQNKPLYSAQLLERFREEAFYAIHNACQKGHRVAYISGGGIDDGEFSFIFRHHENQFEWLPECFIEDLTKELKSLGYAVQVGRYNKETTIKISW